MVACHRCGTAFPSSGKPSRQDACAKCHAWLRSCKNCEFYSPKSKNDCLEPQAEPVVDKEQSNFCELYAPNKRSGSLAPSASGGKDPFDSLFGGKKDDAKAGGRSEPAAKDGFDSLFKK